MLSVAGCRWPWTHGPESMSRNFASPSHHNASICWEEGTLLELVVVPHVLLIGGGDSTVKPRLPIWYISYRTSLGYCIVTCPDCFTAHKMSLVFSIIWEHMSFKRDLPYSKSKCSLLFLSVLLSFVNRVIERNMSGIIWRENFKYYLLLMLPLWLTGKPHLSSLFD